MIPLFIDLGLVTFNFRTAGKIYSFNWELEVWACKWYFFTPSYYRSLVENNVLDKDELNLRFIENCIDLEWVGATRNWWSG